MEKFDFSGWATKNNLKCSDGRTIMKDAFKHNDGAIVPLVWNHQHNDPLNVLGHALLENREDGVYAYCSFNDTEAGIEAKKLVEHGDVTSLSIYANQLKQQGNNVVHGSIREVSLVLAGANPGAFIDSVMSHGEDSEEEGTIYLDEKNADLTLEHGCSGKTENKEEKEKKTLEHEDKTAMPENGEKKEKTVGDVLDELTEEQLEVVYRLVGEALNQNKTEETEGGNDNMKHNVFDNEGTNENVLSHSEMETIIADAKRFGSMKESVLQHSGEYGIDQIEYLFPDDRNVTNVPEFVKRDTGWVNVVMNSVHHTPFSRIKSIFADITEDEARAKGYIKGKLKKEEVFGLLKRTTTPTTIYKKQKMDRDDVVDITDFDVISWLKSEMRLMLDEEIARAILFGDNRLESSDDKINEQCIRPIWKDAPLYSINTVVTNAANATDDDKAKAFIKAIVKARKDYKGSGNPTLFTTEDMLTNCLLLEDTLGHRLYKNADEVAQAMRVKTIVTVPVMDNLTRVVESNTLTLDGIVVNLADYNVGADKGGAVNMFDDFDIDYNQQKYLIETRCSGALVKPYSAIVIESKTAAAAAG